MTTPTEARGSAPGAASAAPFEERALPTQVSAAWELELLISGAVTFALLQLPDEVEAIRDVLLPVLGGTRTGLLIATMGAVYAKAALYTLIVAFVVNLAARTYWVGLVGLHSVFPHGPRWERMRMGPVFTEMYRSRSPSLPAVIARVDNFASVIFSFAFLIVVWVVVSVVGVSLFGAAGWLVARLLFGGRHAFAIGFALGTLVMAPGLVAGLVDKRRGDRLAPGSRARLARWARVASRLSGSTLYGPIFFTLTSNLGRTRMMALAYVTLLGALVFSMAERFARDGIGVPSGPAFVPTDPDLRGVHAEHYESLLPPRAGDRNVTIQADVIEGPYVRLFIPFRDERHAEALRRCPSAAAVRPPAGMLPTDGAPADAEAARVLACLTTLHDVRLDGARVPTPGFRFYRHPSSGVRGILAYLPASGLAPGAHALVVQPVPPLPAREARPRPNPPIEIPFWR